MVGPFQNHHEKTGALEEHQSKSRQQITDIPSKQEGPNRQNKDLQLQNIETSCAEHKWGDVRDFG